MPFNWFPVLFAAVVLVLTFAPRKYVLTAVIGIPVVALAFFAFQEFVTPNRKHRPRGPKYTVPRDTLQR